MVLAIVGALFLVMGLFAGGVLVAGPLGLAAVTPGLMLWILFPLFSIAGYTLFAIGARVGNIRTLSLGVSIVLMLLAVVAAGALVLEAAGVVKPVGSTISLWYVLVVAGALGAFGSATHAKTGEVAEAK